jgi:hypothetical protein
MFEGPKLFPHYTHHFVEGVCSLCGVKQCDAISRDLSAGAKAKFRRCLNRVIDPDREIYQGKKVVVGQFEFKSETSSSRPQA